MEKLRFTPAIQPLTPGAKNELNWVDMSQLNLGSTAWRVFWRSFCDSANGHRQASGWEPIQGKPSLENRPEKASLAVMKTPGTSTTLMAGSLAAWVILGPLGCGRPEENPASSSKPAASTPAAAQYPGGLTPLPNASHDDAQLAQIQKADELAGAGDWTGAADLLRKAGAAESGDDELLFNLAFYEGRAGQTDAALTHYRAALKVNPKHVEANNNLGNLFLRRNDLTNAAAHFAEAIRINPKHPSAHNNLGIVLARQNRAPEAIPEFEAAVRFKPDYLEAWINLGNAATSHGLFQQAVTAYEMALRIRPGMPQAVEALKRARARIAPTGG